MKKPFTRLPFVLLTLALICSILNLASCTITTAPTTTTSTYNLSTSVVPSGSGTVSPSGGAFQGKVTLVATPAQYFTFSGWAGSALGNNNPLTVAMNSDEQVVAQFTKIQYTVQVTSNIPNGGTVSPGSRTYDAGTTVTIIATPATGYRFLNWGTDATGSSSSLNLLINGNKNITANFIPEYTLTVSADPSEGTVSNKGGIYDANSTVNLTATSVFPYAFNNWSGTDNDSVNPTKVTMNSNKSVTANFQKLTAGQLVTNSQDIWGGGNTSISIELTQSEWVQGELWGPYFTAVIQDPNGAIVKNLGAIQDVNFTFQAKISGNYIIALVNTNTLTAASYKLTYNIYQ